MPRPREDIDRQTRRRIADLAEQQRRTMAALPFWEINDTSPELVLIGKDLNQPVATPCTACGPRTTHRPR